MVSTASGLEKRQSEGEVSNCVTNLIHAFTDGLNVFKRLRERRRKRRKSKGKDREEGVSGEELQLSNSLRRGPKDIQERYERCYGEKGESFARGDAIAHASLAETLIKLNTGLVGIIATFLNHHNKNSHLDLDYKSLTNLSDTSRKEAIHSLNQLYQRLSQSQLQLHRMASPKADPEKRRRNTSRQRSNGPTVTRVPVKASTHTQLALVRPKPGRKSSASSTSSSKSHSTATSSPYLSPVGSPLPQYSPRDPYPPQKAHAGRPTAPSGRRRAGSFDGPRPTTWPHTLPASTAPPTLALPPPLPSPPKCPPPRRTPPPKLASPPPSAGLARRRADKPTPSTYTFASDSTKLGEIPQRNWTVPWDYEEAERLNAEAAAAAYPVAVGGGGGESKARGKKGLFRFLRRGSAQGT